MLEIIILTAIVFGFIGNIFLTRYFFKQLLQKLSHSTSKQNVNIARQQPLSKFSWQGKTDPLLNSQFPINQPTANQVMNENTNMVDFDENVPLPGVDSTLKFEVEGGDSNIPPGFEATV